MKKKYCPECGGEMKIHLDGSGFCWNCNYKQEATYLDYTDKDDILDYNLKNEEN